VISCLTSVMVNRQFSILLCIVAFCAHISNGLKIKKPKVVNLNIAAESGQNTYSKPNAVQESKPNAVQESKPNTVQESKPNTVQESKPNTVQKAKPLVKEQQSKDVNAHRTRFVASDFAAILGIFILPLGLCVKEDKKFAFAVLIVSVFMGILGTYHKWYLVGWKLGHHPSTNSILLCVLLVSSILLGIGIHYFDKDSRFMIGFFATLLIINIPYQIMLISVTNKNPLFVRIPVLMTLSIIGGLICTTKIKYMEEYSKPFGIGLISSWMFVGGVEHFGARLRWWQYMALSPEPRGYFFRNPKIIFTKEYIHPFLFLLIWFLLTPISAYCRYKHQTLLNIIKYRILGMKEEKDPYH